MAKLKYLRDMLTPDELDIIRHVMSAESFRTTAWRDYGPDWKNHVPTAINAFVNYYFGTELFPWQLAVYYAPQELVIVPGGRGCGKSTTILGFGAYIALHPGENHLHCSISIDQSRLAWSILQNFGEQAQSGRPSFFERFIAESKASPYPELTFYPWDENDPGSHIWFRTLGDVNGIERLRSFEAGNISVDEAFRQIQSFDTYAQLRGCIRGYNRYALAAMPPAQRAIFDKHVRSVMYAPNTGSATWHKKQIKGMADEWGLNKRRMMCLYGNVAAWDWMWDWFDKGETDPEHVFSIRVTTRDNPLLGDENIKAIERALGDNHELAAQEMNAERPRGTGGVFKWEDIRNCINQDLNKLAEENIGRPGYTYARHERYGLMHYAIPPDPDHMHVIGADPGTFLFPMRNKWCIMVYDVSVTPARLVFFECGNLSRDAVGSFKPFWARLNFAAQTYQTLSGDIWVESSGPQKGMAELAVPEDLAVTPVAFTGRKLALINQLRQLLTFNLIEFPEIQRLTYEHDAYEYQDAELNQDIVMAHICAAGAIWQYIRPEYRMAPPQAQEPDGEIVHDRNYRDGARDSRAER